MNQSNLTYVLKINLNEINNLNSTIEQTIDKINTNDNIITNYDSINDDIVIMTKNEYREYILDNNGYIINDISTLCSSNNNYHDNEFELILPEINKCSICLSSLEIYQKKYKLNLCSHLFHYDCINNWYKTISNKIFEVHSCPLCRSSNESMYNLQ